MNWIETFSSGIMESFTNVFITLVTFLFSAGAWQFYQNRQKIKHEERQGDRQEQTLYRDDLRERVAVLEQKLEEERREKESVLNRLAEVMTQMAEYKIRIEFLEKENERLKER